MAETARTKTSINEDKRQKRVRKFIYAELRTPAAVLKQNAMIRSTQWEPVNGLPKQVNSLGDMVTAGLIP
jgi:hypothetical protein